MSSVVTDIYVRVVSEKKTVGGMIEEVDHGVLTRKVRIAAVPVLGQNIELNDCGRRVELGRVRYVNHVCQPEPSPFAVEESDSPAVEVTVEKLTNSAEAFIERLKGQRFHEVP